MSQSMQNLGIITFLMMQNETYNSWPMDKIRRIVTPPLMHQLAVTATLPNKNPEGQPVPMAFALFAKLNDSWDAKLRDPGFDLADLPSDAWTTGGNKWLVALLSTQKASGLFVEQAARAIWPKGGTLHIRGMDAGGAAEIGKRRF